MNRRRTASGIRKPLVGITIGMNDASEARRSEKNGEKVATNGRQDRVWETLGGDYEENSGLLLYTVQYRKLTLPPFLSVPLFSFSLFLLHLSQPSPVARSPLSTTSRKKKENEPSDKLQVNASERPVTGE